MQHDIKMCKTCAETCNCRSELQVLSSVFVPLLAQQAGGDKHALMSSGDDRGQSSLLNEFLADLNKFVGQVGQTLHELQGMQLSLGCIHCCCADLVPIVTRLDVQAASQSLLPVTDAIK